MLKSELPREEHQGQKPKGEFLGGCMFELLIVPFNLTSHYINVGNLELIIYYYIL